MTRTFTHEITLHLPIDQAFTLFTPKGEEAWVPGWEPEYISPPTGETEAEMLFTTGTGKDKTFWTCMQWEPDLHHTRYLRITPEARAAFVDVQCVATSDTETSVTVSYTLSGLSKAGQAFIDATTQEYYAAMIDEWEMLIHGTFESA